MRLQRPQDRQSPQAVSVTPGDHRWGHAEGFMNAHKGILREMKCDRSFEIIHLFTEGILETVRPRQFRIFFPQAERNPSRPASTD